MDPNPIPNRFGPRPPQPTNPINRHRRRHSDTIFRLPDDLLFDSDPDPDPDPDFSISDIGLPALSDDVISSPPTAAAAGGGGGGGGGDHRHGRTLSVDAAFFEGLGFQAHGAGGRVHKRSGSMDEADSSSATSSDYAKKAMPADKLAELALLDPKRAKRILANRESAARSKERKIQYTSELERKVQTLQTESTTLSTQVTFLQRDTTSLTNENRKLKLRLHAMEQQAHLHEALNKALREEVQRLKIEAGHIPNINGNSFNRGSQYFSCPQQQQLSNSNAHQAQTPPNGLSLRDNSQHDSMDM